MPEIFKHRFSSTIPDRFCDQVWSTTWLPVRLSSVPSMERKRFKPSESLAPQFRDHAKQWKRDVAYISSSTIRHKNKHYQAIIKLGKDVIPLILKELEKGPSDWFFALHRITGEDPISEKDIGDFRKMADQWLDWGTRNGYLSK